MDLSIIIVNWNTGDLLRKCLDALPAAVRSDSQRTRRDSRLEYEVFVVDNASADTSLVFAQQSTQPFELIKLPENRGFAHANNLALKKARGNVVLLLNPDTEPKSGSLVALKTFFDAHPHAGIVGGKLFNTDGSPQPSVRRLPTPAVLAVLLSRVSRFLKHSSVIHEYEMRDFSYARDARVEQVMGACFAIRQSVYQTLGGLDERFWIWFEEVDYCARVLDAGFEVWFTPSVQVTHHRATSFRTVSAFQRARWFAASALRYSRKHFGMLPTLGVALITPWTLLSGVGASFMQMKPRVKQTS